MKTIKKIIATIKLIKVHKEDLLKELNDLTGITKIVISEILNIWK